MGEDDCMISHRPAHDTEASTSHAALPVSDVAVAQPEQELHHSGASRAPLDEAQAE
jgi:hypothetical protein